MEFIVNTLGCEGRALKERVHSGALLDRLAIDPLIVST